MTKNQFGQNILLFFVSPILATIPAIRSFGKRYTKAVLILFFGLYGATMIFPPGTDGSRHSASIENHYVGLEFGEFIEETIAIFAFRPEPETNDDFFLHLISYIAAFFSSSTSGLYTIVGLIYGYFFVTGISKVYNEIKGNGQFTFIVITLFILFISWKSFEGINSIRNHTGGWIFFNGAFSYFQTKQRKYLLLVLLAPLVHFGYFILTVPFYVVYFFGNRPLIYLGVFIASLFASPSVDSLKVFSEQTELGQSKFDAYVKDEAYFQKRTEARLNRQSFHIAYYMTFIRYFLTFMLFLSIIFAGYITKNDTHSHFLGYLASMAILLLAASNLSSFAESLAKRFYINHGFYALSYLTILYSTISVRYQKPLFYNTAKLATFVGLPVVGLFLFTQYSLIGEFTDMRILVSPFMYPFLEGEELSIKELLKKLLL